jgi:hypothetical protein
MRHRQLVQLAQTRRWVVVSDLSTVVSPAGYNKIHETNPTIKVRTSVHKRTSLWNTDRLRTSGIVSSSPSLFSRYMGDRSDKIRL